MGISSRQAGVTGGPEDGRYGRIFKEFSFLTGIRFEFHDRADQFRRLDGPMREKIASGALPGTYDSAERTAHVYTGLVREQGTPAADAHVFALACSIVFRNLPFRDVFPGIRLGVAARRAMDGPEPSGAFSAVLDPAAGTGAFRTVAADRQALGGLADGLLRAFGAGSLATQANLRARFADALGMCLSRSADLMVAAGGKEALSGQVAAALRAGADAGRPSVYVGDLTWPGFRAAGYPEAGLVVSIGNLEAFRTREGLGVDEFARRFADAFASPLALLSDAKYPKAKLVLDVGTGGFLCLSPAEPAAAVRKVLVEKERRSGRTMVPASAYGLDGSAVGRDIANGRVLYLAERKGRFGTREYAVVKAIEKKVEAECLAGIRSASAIQPLLSTVTKVTNNFRNPSAGPEKSDPVREYLDRRASYLAELDATLRLEGAPAQPEAESLPSRPAPPAYRSGDPLPDGVVSKASLEKLRKAGAHTYGGLLSLGGMAVGRLTDGNTVRKLEAHLATMGRTLFPRVRACSPDAFSRLDPEGRERAALGDFSVAVRYLPENIRTLPVLLPVGLDGMPVTGSAGLHLAVKGASLRERWGGCPVFALREELDRDGFRPLPAAEAVNVLRGDGSYASYYNINDTDMAVADPDLYARLSAGVEAAGLTVDPYFNALFGAFRESVAPAGGEVPAAEVATGRWRLFRGAYRRFGETYGRKVAELCGSLAETDRRHTCDAVNVTRANAAELVASGRVPGTVLETPAGPCYSSGTLNYAIPPEGGLWVVRSPRSGRTDVLPAQVFRRLYEQRPDGRYVRKEPAHARAAGTWMRRGSPGD